MVRFFVSQLLLNSCWIFEVLKFLSHVFILCVYVGTYICSGACGDIRGQFAEVSSLPIPCEFQDLNLNAQIWQ